MATTFEDPLLISIADRVLKAARPNLARLHRLGIDVSASPATPGDTIKVPLVNAGAAAQYDATTNNYCNASGSVSYVPVTLSSHPVSTISITPEDARAADVTNIQRVAVESAGEAVAVAALTAYHGLLPAAGGTTSAQFDATLTTAAGFAAMRAAVVKGIAADGGRPAFAATAPAVCDLVLGPAAYSTALTLFDVMAWAARMETNPVRDGWFEGGLLGFRSVVEDPLIDEASVVGYVVARDALAFAARPVEVRNPSAYAAYDYRTDDQTGLTLTYREHAESCTDTRYLNVEALFGGAVAQGDRIVTLV